LENAFNADDSDIALVLCHDTEVSLYQAKKSAKHDKNQTVAKGIATSYISLASYLRALIVRKEQKPATSMQRNLGKKRYVYPTCFLTEGSYERHFWAGRAEHP
jgi:hypothetical protein